ncbi:hypothetical protein GPALN_004915 [Globodera pallida]|nr:hypothetical protein GPALN_004915 [Globodera pallida]
MAFERIGQNYEPVLLTDKFYTTVVHNLQIDSILTFRVKPHNPKDYPFTILLLHNRPAEHEKVENLIEGDIIELGPPRIAVPTKSGENIRRNFTKFTKKLNTLLNYNDIITIEVEIYQTSTNFSIYLMDEALEPSNKIGDIVLALNFTVNGTTSTQCQYHLHELEFSDEFELNESDVVNKTSYGDRVDNHRD